ncbi:MAG: glycosyltransferase family 4 protein [bacterium]
MKIVMVSDYLPELHSTWGGAEQACLRLANLLTKNGDKIYVITTRPKKASFTHAPRNSEAESASGVSLQDFAFNHITLPVLEDFFPFRFKKIVRGIKTLVFPFDLFSYFSFKRYLKEIKPDIIHLHNMASLSFSLILAANKQRTPVLLTAYDYWFFCPVGFLWKLNNYFTFQGENCSEYHGSYCYDCLIQDSRISRLQMKIVKYLLPFRRMIFDFFLKRISGFIILSQANAKAFESYQIKKDRIHVVHIPLGRKRNHHEFPIEKNSILFLGWLHPRKGLHVLIEAMKYVLKEVPEAKLYAIGGDYDGAYKENIMANVSQYHMENNIFFLGKRPYDFVERYLKKAYVLVIPEQWETIAPNALTEGMVYGKVVIASRIGGNCDIIKDNINGLLVEYDNPKDYAEKIISVLKNDYLAYSLRENARKKTHIFSEKNVYKELSSAYRKYSSKGNLN